MIGPKNKLVEDFRDIRQALAWHPDIMSAQAESVALLKEIIWTKLSQQDRNIILLYIQYLSYRELGRQLRISHTTIGKQVVRIKRIILEEYRKMIKK